MRRAADPLTGRTRAGDVGQRRTRPTPHPALDWSLHLTAHRTVPAAAALAVLFVLATLFDGTLTTLVGLSGPQPVPTVCLMAVLSSPVIVWWLQPRTALEQVTTRRLSMVALTSVWVATVGPAALGVALFESQGLYLRAMLASTGLTVLTWRLTHHALSALPSVLWFVVAATSARLIPAAEYWAFHIVPGTQRTWIIPVLLAMDGMMPNPRFASMATRVR